mmetsp:Transcript_15704/g.18138  ORF Transcript_15704/g.18138 Transcript_15704/m.18138 type:complete len:257 (-) Transcript_15704:860-1630(-)
MVHLHKDETLVHLVDLFAARRDLFFELFFLSEGGLKFFFELDDLEVLLEDLHGVLLDLRKLCRVLQVGTRQRRCRRRVGAVVKAALGQVRLRVADRVVSSVVLNCVVGFVVLFVVFELVDVDVVFEHRVDYVNVFGASDSEQLAFDAGQLVFVRARLGVKVAFDVFLDRPDDFVQLVDLGVGFVELDEQLFGRPLGVRDRGVSDRLGSVAKAQRRQRFTVIVSAKRARDDKARQRVAPDRLLQYLGQLRVPVRHVL